MTNAEIILEKAVELMKEGKLRGTNNYFHYHGSGGDEYIQIPVPLMTEKELRSKGYVLSSGEAPREEYKAWLWVPIKGGKMIKSHVQLYSLDQLQLKL